MAGALATPAVLFKAVANDGVPGNSGGGQPVAVSAGATVAGVRADAEHDHGGQHVQQLGGSGADPDQVRRQGRSLMYGRPRAVIGQRRRPDPLSQRGPDRAAGRKPHQAASPAGSVRAGHSAASIRPTTLDCTTRQEQHPAD